MLSNTKNGGKPRCSRRVIKGSVTQHDSSSNMFLRRRLRQKYFCISSIYLVYLGVHRFLKETFDTTRVQKMHYL
jgi:hypothetical protein